MASTPPLSSIILQIAGVGGAAWLSGNIGGLSLIAVPALAQTHSEDSIPARTLVVQWKRLYDKGFQQNPPIAIGIAAVLSYLAWTAESAVRFGLASQQQLYIASVVLTMGITPWTLIVMAGTNGALHHKAAKVMSMSATKGSAEEWGAEDEKEVARLLGTWNLLNGLRSLLPLAGFVAGALAVLPA